MYYTRTFPYVRISFHVRDVRGWPEFFLYQPKYYPVRNVKSAEGRYATPTAAVYGALSLLCRYSLLLQNKLWKSPATRQQVPVAATKAAWCGGSIVIHTHELGVAS